jgi:CxxC motif-containing protein (DUF1111 family)
VNWRAVAPVVGTIGLSIGLSLVTVTIPLRVRVASGQGAPTDPGSRTSANLFTFSQPYSTLSSTEFKNLGCPDGTIGSCSANTGSAAQGIFNEQWSVTGSVSGQPAAGLGPRYSANGCFWCHGSPVAGGSSPAINPEVAMATLNQRSGFEANVVPTTNYFAPDGSDGQPFIRSGGPVRAPFQRSTGRQLQLYIIGGLGGPGMTDIISTLPACTSTILPQPNYASLLGANDISPTIPIPLFGEGLIEATQDANWRAQQNPTKFAAFSIPTNTLNIIDDTPTIAKIGWKGYISSVNYFGSLALATELGASRELFPMKIDQTPQCNARNMPDDHPPLTSRATCSGCSMDFASAAEGNAYFATHLESPEPVWGTAAGAYDGPPPSGWSGSSVRAYTTASTTVTQGSVYNGYQQFVAMGCDTCHTPSHTTGPSQITGIGNKTYYNYGDGALHHMGVGMNNGITRGLASGDQFRSANLWGTGQRLWFNHDGRTNSLYAAIEAHCTTGSEATAVCTAFGGLSLQNQQDLINFLRGL